MKDMNLPRVGFGQSSKRFLPPETTKPCIIAGIIFENIPGFQDDSDGDVVFHALCNAITSLSHVQIMCGLAVDLLIKEGITDSEVYLKKALQTLHKETITHVAITLEAKRPRFKEHYEEMRENIARILDLTASQVGITAISGESLTDCSLGEGVHCMAIITTIA